MPKKKTIFIIEDEPAICELLTRVLSLEGYDTVVAHNGAQALEMLKTMEPPSLILLDVVMPEMNGTEFLKKIQADHMLVTIPVAIVSAYGAPQDTPKQAKTFIKKPIDIDALLKFIKEWCG